MAAKAQISAARYYEDNNGDMSGYKGTIIKDIHDILALDTKGNGGTKKLTRKPGTKIMVKGRPAVISEDGDSFEYTDGKK